MWFDIFNKNINEALKNQSVSSFWLLNLEDNLRSYIGQSLDMV